METESTDMNHYILKSDYKYSILDKLFSFFIYLLILLIY